jgi:4-hydroxy-2-oxoheptanedioate aldolase
MSVRVLDMVKPWTVLRRQMHEGRVTGTFVKLGALEVIDILAVHYDFAVVDLEHSQLDDHQARSLIRHARALGFPVVVRIASPDRERVNRLLEAGAAGLQLSTVRSVADVVRLRSLMRYAPDGDRSISLGQSGADYGDVGLHEYLAGQGDGPLLVAQIETATTDDPLADIAAAGPDVLFIGPMDLIVALDHDSERFDHRVAEIAEAAEQAAVALGGAGLASTRVRYDVVGSDIATFKAGIDRLTQEGTIHGRQ